MEKDIVNMVEQHTGKEIPLHEHEAFLMIIVEANSEEGIQDIASRIGDICLDHGAIDIFLPGSQRAKRNLLEAREKFYTAIGHFGMTEIIDAVVPRSKIAEFIERSKEMAKQYNIPLIAYGHAGDGNVHLHPLSRKGEEVDEEKTKELLSQIYKIGVSLGGTISGEHGLGLAKKGYLPLASANSQIELMKRIKRAFEPNNIMNPGKVFD